MRDIHTRVSPSRFTVRRLATPALACAFSLALGAGRAQATTINVDVAGAAQSGHCNITDAIQAVSTNVAVHSCPAGSSSGTDTIVLKANTVYQNYNKPLSVPTTGGALVIRGASASSNTTIVRSANFGFPSPNPTTSQSCPGPAALFTGGSLTVQNVTFQNSKVGTPGLTGICQYAGALTLNHVVVGDNVNTFSPVFNFTWGGVRSSPNSSNVHRTLTMTNDTEIFANTSPVAGGGVHLFGNVDTVINGQSLIEFNQTDESGGGIFWGGQFGKMGNLTLDTFIIADNNANGGWGGGVNLSGDDLNASVTITGPVASTGSFILENVATQTGGGVFVGSAVGPNKLLLKNTTVENNIADVDRQQDSFNSDAVTISAVNCNTSTVFSMTGSEWPVPPLHGNGTCAFP